MMYEQTVSGHRPAASPFPVFRGEGGIRLSGVHRREGCPDTRQEIVLRDADMARGVLFLGSARCGKTNVIAECAAQEMEALDDGLKMIILDVKGEYFEALGIPDDLCIGMDRYGQCWNLFSDILAWGEDRETIGIHTAQLVSYLFADQRNAENPYFVQAASVIVSCVIQYFIRAALFSGDRSRLHNRALREFFTETGLEGYLSLIDEYEDFHSARAYLTEDGKTLTRDGAGVLSEIDIMVRRIFNGSFARRGSFSLINWLQEPGGGVLFLSSKLEAAESANPVLAYMIDSALDALSAERMRHPVKTRLYLDEWAQLPMLRSLGKLSLLPYRNVGTVLGLQDVLQMHRHYSAADAERTLNLFQTLVCFRGQEASVRYLQGRLGDVTVRRLCPGPGGKTGNGEAVRRKAVEDYEMQQLQTGEAVVCLPVDSETGEMRSFQFRFDRFGSEEMPPGTDGRA